MSTEIRRPRGARCFDAASGGADRERRIVATAPGGGEPGGPAGLRRARRPRRSPGPGSPRPPAQVQDQPPADACSPRRCQPPRAWPCTPPQRTGRPAAELHANRPGARSDPVHPPPKREAPKQRPRTSRGGCVGPSSRRVARPGLESYGLPRPRRRRRRTPACRARPHGPRPAPSHDPRAPAHRGARARRTRVGQPPPAGASGTAAGAEDAVGAGSTAAAAGALTGALAGRNASGSR